MAMNFSYPERFLLLIPTIAALLAVFYRQYRAVAAVDANISRRFIGKFTNYGKIKIYLHFMLLAIACAALALASSGPWSTDPVISVKKGDRVIFIIDASLSMIAGDVNEQFKTAAKSRSEEASVIAAKIMDAMPGNRYGLVTFSGVAAYNSPPTDDHGAVKNYLKNMRFHVYQKPGTDFKAALDVLVHAAENEKGAGFQGIVISDGESKDSGDYAEAAEALAERGIPVHCIGVGTEDGSGLSLFVPEDVIAGVQKPRIAKEITTYREDSVLEDIAGITGGIYMNMEDDYSIDSLINSVKDREVPVVMDDSQGRKDISHYFIIIFAVIFFLDMLVFDNRFIYRRVESALLNAASGAGAWLKKLR